MLRLGRSKGASGMKKAHLFLIVLMVAVLVGTCAGSGYAAAPGGSLEPLADHLPPPAFTRDHEAWLSTVVAQLAVLTRQFQTLPPDAKAEKVEALRVRIESLQAEWRDLEAHQRVWETYRQEAADPPVITVPSPAGPRLDRSALAGLCRQYRFIEAFGNAAGAASTPASNPNEQAPAPGGTGLPRSPVPLSAEQWEQLADQFEALLRTAQTTEGPDGALALRGRLLQGSCYLSASVLRFRANHTEMHMRDYLRGVRVLDWVAQHEGLASELPLVREARDQGLSRWPDAYVSLFGQPTVSQARTILSEFCPWGAETYVMLMASGLMNGFDWRALPYYGSEKISVALVSNRWVPQLVERDMQEIVTGSYARAAGAEDFRWWKEPEPTYTIWHVSPRVFDIQASTVLACALKVNKLLFGGPDALLIDVWKDVAFDKVGQYFGQGGGVHCALGHGGNLLGISVIDPFWLDPQAGWTFFEKNAAGVTEFKPSKMFSPDWGDLFKGALMDGLRRIEKAEIDLLFDSIRPDNADLNAAFGDPKTYDGSPMPAILIRADVLGWQVMPEDRYRRCWHMVRYYRFDSRTVLGQVGLSETPAERAARKAAAWQGTTQWPARAWGRLPEPYGMRLHLNDVSPKAQVLRYQIPKEVLDVWRTKATRDAKILRAELILPDALAKLGPIRAPVLPASEDLHVSGIHSLLSPQDREVWEARDARRAAEATPVGPEIGGEATFILLNAPMMSSPDEWVDLYAYKLWLVHVPRDRVKEMLTQVGVKAPPVLPHLMTEYGVRVVLDPPEATGGSAAPAPPEQLAEAAVRLLPRPGKPATGDATDIGPGYLMVKQAYDGPVPELETPGLPFRRCVIKVRIGSEIKKVHTYSDELKNPPPTATHVIGTQGPPKAEDWEGSERGARDYACTAVGSFHGNTFTGTWKDTKSSATFKETQTGQMTVTLGGPIQRFPANASDAQAVLIPSQVTGFQASWHSDTDASRSDAVYKTSTEMVMSGSGASLHTQSSTVLAAMPWRLRTVFDTERMQRQIGYATLNYLLTGAETASKVKIQWSKTLTYTKSQEQQTLTKTEGEGVCTISFMFF